MTVSPASRLCPTLRKRLLSGVLVAGALALSVPDAATAQAPQDLSPTSPAPGTAPVDLTAPPGGGTAVEAPLGLGTPRGTLGGTPGEAPAVVPGSAVDQDILIPPVADSPPAALRAPRRLAPTSLSPARSAAPGLNTPAVRPGTDAGTSVGVGTLDSLSPEATGVLDKKSGGLGDEMWMGSDYARITELVSELPVGTSSRAMRDLMRRVLLTRAAIPAGASEDMPSLVAARVQALADMGDLPSVSALLDAVPRKAASPALARAEVDARFLANDLARACEISAREIERDPAVHWQKAMVFCQILAGESGKADLGLSLLREVGQGDPAFFTISEVLLGGEGTLESLPDVTPLTLAMARAAKVDLPPDVVGSDQPGVLRSIAVNPTLDIDIRLDVAERAETAGALDAEALRQLYTSVEFAPDDLARPLTVAAEVLGPRARALLYQSAAGQRVPAAKAEIIARALEIARDEGRYQATARAFQDQVDVLVPTAELLWFAPEAVRIFLADGDRERARSWFSLLLSDALFREDSLAQVRTLTPLILINGGLGLEQEPTDLIDWLETRLAGSAPAPEAGDSAGLLFGLLGALGDPVSPDLWTALPAGPQLLVSPAPNAAVWFRMKALLAADQPSEQMPIADTLSPGPGTDVPTAAALSFGTSPQAGATVSLTPGRGVAPIEPETGSLASLGGIGTDAVDAGMAPARVMTLYRGETVLLALIAMDDAGPARAAPHVTAAGIEAIRLAGLEEEARALALEAALAAGF